MYARPATPCLTWASLRVEPVPQSFDRVPQYPGVIEHGHTAIGGEVYRVDAATLDRVDLLEDIPNSYRRRLIDTGFGRAWIYLYQRYRGDEPVVSSGIWPVSQRLPANHATRRPGQAQNGANHNRPHPPPETRD